VKNARKNWKVIVIGTLILLHFVGCNGKTSAQSASGKKASPVSDFSYDLSTDGTGIKITGYTGKGGVVVIPSTIEDMPVVQITGTEDSNAGAFMGRIIDGGQVFPAINITEIVVPASVTVIGPAAFCGIDNLTKATLSDGIKTLPSAVFRDCRNLTTVNLPASLEEIGMMAFNGCTELNNLIIPEILNSINFIEMGAPGSKTNFAFSGCGKLPIKTRQRIQDLGYPNGF
jgi:hypothetical protein